MTSHSHVRVWKPVTDAVHHEGGAIFFQPWHAGRAQNDLTPMLKESGYPVLAPSPIQAKAGKYRFLDGMPEKTANNTAMTSAHIAEVIEQYRNLCALAKEAGFDGVEIIAQGGYLIHNFLCTRSNVRKYAYGGSVANRFRLLLEVVGAITPIYPPEHMGIKICPTDNVADIACSYAGLSETYTYLTKELVEKEIGFINLSGRGCAKKEIVDDFSDTTIRPEGMGLPEGYEPLREFGSLIKREGSKTKLMVNYGYTVEEAEELIQQGKIDMITFGRLFIYNPDLVDRIRKSVPLAGNDRGGKVNYGPYQDTNEN